MNGIHSCKTRMMSSVQDTKPKERSRAVDERKAKGKAMRCKDSLQTKKGSEKGSGSPTGLLLRTHRQVKAQLRKTWRKREGKG